jgi:hypothetical protein
MDGNAICAEPFSVKASHVVVNRDIWPVLGEDTSAIGIDLAEGFRSHSGSFEAKAEPSNAAEEVKDIHRCARA